MSRHLIAKMRRSASAESEVWYHSSPHELPEGLELIPAGNKSPFSRADYYNQISDRNAEGVWISPTVDDAHSWRSAMEEDGSAPAHIYAVQPHTSPQNHGEDDGWSTSGAKVLRKVFDAFSGDVSGGKQ